MGNAMCCRWSYCQSEVKSMAESEQALLHVTKTSSCRTNDVREQPISPQKSEGSEDPSEPRNRTDNTEDCKSEIIEKTEQENFGTVVNKTMQNHENNGLLDSAPEKCERVSLPGSTERRHLFNVEDSNKQAKIAKHSQCDLSDGDHHKKFGQMQVTISRDETRPKNLGSEQLDFGIEGMRNHQQSEQINTSVKATKQVIEEPDLLETKDNLFKSDVSVAAETDVHIVCNQEGNNGEEDLYRDEDDIEKDKSQRLLDESQLAAVATERSTIEPSMTILEYCTREWKGNTAKAQLIRNAYEAICEDFNSIRRVRGDNYCALRATLFQALHNDEKLPCLQQDDLDQIPNKLIGENHVWIKQWYFSIQDSGDGNPVKLLSGYLRALKDKCTRLYEMDSWEERKAACEELFQTDTEEYIMYEAVKIMMLAKAIELNSNQVQEKDVPLFSWLLFARDTSTSPYEFMKNHLNHVGNTGGLDQVEMFLLGYSLQVTIRVFRLYKFGTDEFITYYPDNHKDDWPMVTLVTEDDRHYNVPMKDDQVTIL
ncbi:ubiquitin thioesterase otulin-like isoform X2 [Rhinoraja longicauda]